MHVRQSLPVMGCGACGVTDVVCYARALTVFVLCPPPSLSPILLPLRFRFLGAQGPIDSSHGRWRGERRLQPFHLKPHGALPCQRLGVDDEVKRAECVDERILMDGGRVTRFLLAKRACVTRMHVHVCFEVCFALL